ncbi:hypothetical protein [Methylobacterium komagatae]
MYDPDSARPALRLATIREAKDRHEERADIERQMEALSLRWSELTMEINADRAQARPIRISGALTDNDFWSHRHRVMGGSQPLVARSTGMMTPLVRAATTGEVRDPVEALSARERP